MIYYTLLISSRSIKPPNTRIQLSFVCSLVGVCGGVCVCGCVNIEEEIVRERISESQRRRRSVCKSPRRVKVYH